MTPPTASGEPKSRTIYPMTFFPMASRPGVAAAAAMAMVCLLLTTAGAAPRPELVPRTWELGFSYEEPRPISVTDDSGTIRWYWYMTYTVVNEGDSDRLYLPRIVAATNEGDIVRANSRIPITVFYTVKQHTRIKLLENPVMVCGRIRPGEDGAKQSVAIWPAFKHDVNRFTVFFTGLSGEARKVLDPRTGNPIVDPASLRPVIDLRTGRPQIDPHTGNPTIRPRPLLLRKTLALEFDVPGSRTHPQLQKPKLREKRWVMR